MNGDSFQDVLDRAARREMTLLDLLGAADKFPALQQQIELYTTWINNNAASGFTHIACFNLGAILSKHGNPNGAKAAYEAAIRANPDFPQSYLNLGSMLEVLGQVDKAVETWSTLVTKYAAVTPDSVSYKAMALRHIGRVYETQKRPPLAETMLQQSIEIQDASYDTLQHYILLRQGQCKWPALTSLYGTPMETILKKMAPLSLAAMFDDAIFQLTISNIYNHNTAGYPAGKFTAGSWAPPDAPRSGRLRIGYLSSDLRRHAIGYLMSEIFELHDRAKVEVLIYYCGPDIPDDVQGRIKSTSDQWTDIYKMSDEQAACKILEDRVDILIDVNGYTNFSRTRLLSMRPAPIIVNWLGYPGTLGSPYHDYIIADDYIVPEKYEVFYSERVMRLPCYQPNDRKRVVSPQVPTRAEAGLPDDAIVYCCFNGSHKITPVIFDLWEQILRQVPNGVLWLMGTQLETNERLKQHAANVGIAPERVIFTGWAANADHVPRYLLADVILDTWPYGAHTTASDALWMGVPVVTLSGRSFASRVCGSLARSAGIPELVCEQPADYVARAVELGLNPAKRQYYKEFLKANRDTCTLFDTPKLVRHLEGLCETMWKEYEAGAIPRPDLTNMGVYLDIGVELQMAGVDLANDRDYFNAYRQRLAYRHSFSSIPADRRLWQNPEGDLGVLNR